MLSHSYILLSSMPKSFLLKVALLPIKVSFARLNVAFSRLCNFAGLDFSSNFYVEWWWRWAGVSPLLWSIKDVFDCYLIFRIKVSNVSLLMAVHSDSGESDFDLENNVCIESRAKNSLKHYLNCFAKFSVLLCNKLK